MDSNDTDGKLFPKLVAILRNNPVMLLLERKWSLMMSHARHDPGSLLALEGGEGVGEETDTRWALAT